MISSANLRILPPLLFSYLQAAGAYAYAEASASFCREHMLHEKTMRQQLQLRQQLSSVVNRHLGQVKEEKKKARRQEKRKQKKMREQRKKYSKKVKAAGLQEEEEEESEEESSDEDEIEELEVTPQLAPPTQEQREILLQVLAAGFITQVARKLPPLDIAFEPQNEDGSMGASSAAISANGTSKDGKSFKGSGGGGSRLQRLCAYESCDPRLKEPLYIHPRSGLFRADPTALPEYIVFQSMARGSYGSRLLFLRGVSAVEPEWLRTAAAGTPLCVLGAPELLMPPVYDPTVDRVLGWSTPSFGPRQWQLPLVKVPLAQTLEFEKTQSTSADIKASELEYRWFARFLLEGKVVPALAQLTEQLKINPNWITGNHLDKRIMLLISALQSKGVSSRSQLRKAWAMDGGAGFLFHEIRSCVRDSQQHVLEHLWPSVTRQV
jgi:ATP-dependent RNA helicase DHX37/DHR1